MFRHILAALIFLTINDIMNYDTAVRATFVPTADDYGLHLFYHPYHVDVMPITTIKDMGILEHVLRRLPKVPETFAAVCGLLRTIDESVYVKVRLREICHVYSNKQVVPTEYEVDEEVGGSHTEDDEVGGSHTTDEEVCVLDNGFVADYDVVYDVYMPDELIEDDWDMRSLDIEAQAECGVTEQEQDDEEEEEEKEEKDDDDHGDWVTVVFTTTVTTTVTTHYATKQKIVTSRGRGRGVGLGQREIVNCTYK